MEVRDAITDGVGSLRPTTPRESDPSDATAIVAGIGVVCAVIALVVIDADAYRPAPAGTWALVALGYLVAMLLRIMVDPRSGRLVTATAVVPMVVGLFHLAPTTLVLVAVGTSVAVLGWSPPDRWRRTLAQTSLWSLETIAAVGMFRAVGSQGLDDIETWTAVALAAGFGIVVRIAGEHLVDWSNPSRTAEAPEPDLSARIADVTAFVIGAAAGIGGVGLAAFARFGVVVGIVGAIAVLTAELLAVRTHRLLSETGRYAAAQEVAVAGVNGTQVVADAARAVRTMLQADVAVVAHGGDSTAVIEADRSTPIAPSAVAEVVARSNAGAVSFFVAPDELPELRSTCALGAGPLYVLCTSYAVEGAQDLAIAAVRSAEGRSFGLGDRRLLQRLTPMVAQSVQASERLTRYRRQARFDELTGLPSRASIETSINDVMAEVSPMGRAMAVLLVDLNGFKAVNDTLGHQTGDVVLAEIGRRIGSVASSADAVGRLGGDEFVVVLADDDRTALGERSEQLASELAVAVGEQIVHGDLVLDVGISVGMAVFPDHGDSPGELLRAADVAMYAAKSRGLLLLPYEGRLDRHRSRRLGLATDLRAALAAEQLEVFFQPKVSFVDGSLVGAEALIRWTHPTLHAVPASEIVDVADHAGLLCDLTDFVLERSARQYLALREVGCEVPIAVNLTERDIADPELPARYGAALSAYGLEPGAITLEITETALLTREVESLGVLPTMSEMGVTIAIDDFGTGFSSLSHLRRFPVDEIKIDMSFVERMVIRPNDAVIVRSIVELGHSLGLGVTAEGVETNEAWNLLEEFGVDVAQGNHVMKAIDADSFLAWAPFWNRHRTARGFMAAIGAVGAETIEPRSSAPAEP